VRHIVQFSSGVGSAYAAWRVIDRYGPNNVTLLFADVRRDDGEWWEGEDPDNYRFAEEVVSRLGVELATVKDGRGVWGLAEDQHMIPNNRAPFCSRILKHETCARWMAEHCDPADTTVHVGIDMTEMDRCDGITARWAPWTVDYPMLWKPYPLKTDAIAWCRSHGIQEPVMYREGFQHANCAGACVRMGNGAAEHLYFTRPEVFKGAWRSGRRRCGRSTGTSRSLSTGGAWQTVRGAARSPSLLCGPRSSTGKPQHPACSTT